MTLPRGGREGGPPKGDVGRLGEGPYFAQRRRRFLALRIKVDNPKFSSFFQVFSDIPLNVCDDKHSSKLIKQILLQKHKLY